MTNNDEMALKLKAAAKQRIDAESCDGVDGRIARIALHKDTAKSFSPENILALLAERDADKKQLAAMSKAYLNLRRLTDVYLHAYEEAKASVAELEALTVSVKLPPNAPENLASVLDGYEKWLVATTFRDTWNACLSEVARVNAAGINLEVGE